MLVWKEPPYDGATALVEFGTVRGDYLSYPEGRRLGSQPLCAPLLAINIVENSVKRNGQFAEYVSQLKQHCASQGWNLGFLDVMERLKGRLMEKHGFVELSGSTHLIYYCSGKAPE